MVTSVPYKLVWVSSKTEVDASKDETFVCHLQMQSRSGMLENNSEGGGSQAPAGSREADLANQIKHLREELMSAQETAAAATGHSKQYEMLAKSSDEAVKVMQARSAAPYSAEWCKSEPGIDVLHLIFITPSIHQICRVQEQLERCKAEYEERIKAIRKEAEDLQGQVAALERGRTEAQQHLHAAEKAVEDANRQAATREAELKVCFVPTND